jgi:Na+/phosphate symporter
LDEKDLEQIDFSKENICKKANDYTKTKIKKYISELKKLKLHPELQKNNSQAIKKKKKLDSVIDSFTKILNKIENLPENECILNI